MDCHYQSHLYVPRDTRDYHWNHHQGTYRRCTRQPCPNRYDRIHYPDVVEEGPRAQLEPRPEQIEIILQLPDSTPVSPLPYESPDLVDTTLPTDNLNTPRSVNSEGDQTITLDAHALAAALRTFSSTPEMANPDQAAMQLSHPGTPQPSRPASPVQQAAPAPPTDPVQLALWQLTHTMNTLAVAQLDMMNIMTNVLRQQTTQTDTRSVTIIEKPQAFKGDDSETARLFRHAFLVWVRANPRAFARRDAQGAPIIGANGVPIHDDAKLIASALSFMQGPAGTWARPYIESVATGQAIFNNDWNLFVEAFKAKFEPVDATAEAKSKIQAMRQAGRNFSSYLAEFEMWSPRTGWSHLDLYDRLKAGLDTDYITRLSYFMPPPADYNSLVRCGKQIDVTLVDLHNNLAAAGKATKPAQQQARPNNASAFRDPNAMDIDASNLDEMFKGLSTREDITAQHRRVMKGRCRVCGSKAHTDASRHQNVTCNWCGKKNHWQKICISRLCGEPRAQAVKATDTSDPAASIASTSTASASATSASSDMEATIAALRDALDAQAKQMAAMQASISKGF